MKRVFKYGERREYPVYDIPEPDVRFILETPHVVIGEDFQIKVCTSFCYRLTFGAVLIKNKRWMGRKILNSSAVIEIPHPAAASGLNSPPCSTKWIEFPTLQQQVDVKYWFLGFAINITLMLTHKLLPSWLVLTEHAQGKSLVLFTIGFNSTANIFG